MPLAPPSVAEARWLPFALTCTVFVIGGWVISSEPFHLATFENFVFPPSSKKRKETLKRRTRRGKNILQQVSFLGNRRKWVVADKCCLFLFFLKGGGGGVVSAMQDAFARVTADKQRKDIFFHAYKLSLQRNSKSQMKKKKIHLKHEIMRHLLIP